MLERIAIPILFVVALLAGHVAVVATLLGSGQGTWPPATDEPVTVCRAKP